MSGLKTSGSVVKSPYNSLGLLKLKQVKLCSIISIQFSMTSETEKSKAEKSNSFFYCKFLLIPVV